MHTKNRLGLFMILVGSIIISICWGTAEASEFLADVVMKGGVTSGDGKVWVKGHRSRQEMGSQTEKMILIMDMNQGYHWTLMPDMKMYLKTKIPAKGKGFHPESFVGMAPGQLDADIKRLGTETVKGYKCDKYLFTFSDKKLGTMTQWFSIKLGYPIKTVNKSDMMGEIITELHNIQKTSIQDDLFGVPSDYREMPSQQMMQMPRQNQ
jgi:outer membrane lipoprotein-sorting protein